MISTREKPTRRPFCHSRPEPKHPELIKDPARLSATLRELAMRAHQAFRVRVGDRDRNRDHTATGRSGHAHSDPGPDRPDQTDMLDRELAELHAQIVHLERSVLAQSLDGLVPYVTALRQRVASLVLESFSP